MAPPPLQTSCQSVQSPSLCIPLKALYNCITSPAAVVPCFPLWLTWSRLYKPQWKPPRKTSCHSKWFSLSPLIQLCVSHPKIVPLLLWLEKVAVECAIQWGDIFTDLSVHVCLCSFSSVDPEELTLSGSLEAIEGQEVVLSCYAASSNPPVDIRWWLGYKELNNTVFIREEVGLHNARVVQTRNPSIWAATKVVQCAVQHLWWQLQLVWASQAFVHLPRK